MKTLAKSFLAFGLSAALVTPAFAAGPFEDNTPRRTAQIKVADLDLATAEGQRTLDKRIEGAVRQVCRRTSLQSGTRIIDKDSLRCLARARAEAKQQVALLTAKAQRGG